MGKHHRSNSCSSSSSSDCCDRSCYVVKKCSSSSSSDCCDSYHEKCPCRPDELCCKYKGSVVNVTGQTLLTQSTQPEAGDLNSFFTYGTGFFVKKDIIVCPAHLVLIPPTVLADHYRYPFVSSPPPALGQVPNSMTQVSRILVDVPQVCDSKGFTYEARLLGVDGAADVAVLQVCSDKSLFNHCNPDLNCCYKHKKRHCRKCAKTRCPFKFGKICEANCGETVYAMGDFNAPSHSGFHGNNQILSGVLSDKNYTEHDGWVLPQAIVVDFPAYNPTSGLPVFDVEGKLLGMQLTSVAGQVLRIADPNNVDPQPTPPATADPFLNFRDGNGGVLAISVEAMKRSVKALSCGPIGKYCCLIENVTDAGVRPFNRIKKSYLGFAYELTDANTITTNVDYTGSEIERDIKVDPVTLQFLPGPDCKKIEGVQVQALSGGNPSTEAVYVPGASNASIYDNTDLQDSPLIGNLVRGDVITEISVPRPNKKGKKYKKGKTYKVHLGDLCKQGAPSRPLWYLPVDDCTCNIQVKYRQAANDFNEELALSVSPLSMPFLMDYPWWAINEFFRHVVITTGLQNPKIGVPSFKAAV